MLERLPVGVRQQEILVPVGDWPGEGQDGLRVPVGGPQREILTVLPLTTLTFQPAARKAAAKAALSPAKRTLITELPPSARLVVIAEATPLTRLTPSSARCTEPASGVETWTLKF